MEDGDPLWDENSSIKYTQGVDVNGKIKPFLTMLSPAAALRQWMVFIHSSDVGSCGSMTSKGNQSHNPAYCTATLWWY